MICDVGIAFEAFWSLVSGYWRLMVATIGAANCVFYY